MTKRKFTYLTVWKLKGESVKCEYGILPYISWCKREQKRIPGTELLFKDTKEGTKVCLIKYKTREEENEAKGIPSRWVV